MHPFASALATASLLAASGCCFPGASGACVADAGQRCDSFEGPIECTWDSPETPEPETVCPGTFHVGASCPDLGYTIRCGGFYVRPGTRC